MRDTLRVNFIATGYRERKRRRSIPFKSSIKTPQFNFNSMAALDRLRWTDEAYLQLKVYKLSIFRVLFDNDRLIRPRVL